VLKLKKSNILEKYWKKIVYNQRLFAEKKYKKAFKNDPVDDVTCGLDLESQQSRALQLGPWFIDKLLCWTIQQAI
jgi:hypothetical protein